MATTNLGLEQILRDDVLATTVLEKINSNMLKVDAAYGQLIDTLFQKTGKNTLKDAIDYIDMLVNAQDATITADKIFKGYTGYKGLTKITGTALSTSISASTSEVISGNTFYDNTGTLLTGTMTNKAGTSTAASASISGDNYRLQIPTTGYYSTGSYLTRAKSSVISDLGVKQMPTINVTCDASSSYITSYGAGINNSGVLVIWALTASTSYEHVYFYPSSISIGSKGVGWSETDWDTGDPVACYACTVTGLSSYKTINVTLDYNTYSTSYDYVRLDVSVSGS